MEVERSEITPYESLVAYLQDPKFERLSLATKNDSLVNEITTRMYESDTFKVYLTESGFVADIVLTIHNYYLFLTYLDSKVVLVGANHRLSEAPADIATIINGNLLNEIRYNISTDQDFGTFPHKRGKTLTAWNFYNNRIYLMR